MRRRVPDLSAVTLCHELLAARLRPGGLYVDATCGNGHDTLFLCGLAGENGRVLGLDIQPAAVEATNRRLAAAEFGGVGRAVLCGHENLLTLVEPGTADCVLFNFGWLPGADHAVHSGTATTLPALRAACTALRPGGVLAAVLYSGSVIGSGENRPRWTLEVCRLHSTPPLCANSPTGPTPPRCPAWPSSGDKPGGGASNFPPRLPAQQRPQGGFAFRRQGGAGENARHIGGGVVQKMPCAVRNGPVSPR